MRALSSEVSQLSIVTFDWFGCHIMLSGVYPSVVIVILSVLSLLTVVG